MIIQLNGGSVENIQIEISDVTLRIVRNNCVLFSCIYGDGPLVMPRKQAWEIFAEHLQRLVDR